MAPNYASPPPTELRRLSTEGSVSICTEIASGVTLRSDPSLKVSGQWRSPPGRLLEIDVRMGATGAWIGLHLTLEAPDLSDFGWLGFACRLAAPEEIMIRPCLRSGTQDGFIDCFFGKHILAVPEVRDHLDALHPATNQHLPETAPWRELILFLPQQDFRLHLHDLRPFLA